MLSVTRQKSLLVHSPLHVQISCNSMAKDVVDEGKLESGMPSDGTSTSLESEVILGTLHDAPIAPNNSDATYGASSQRVDVHTMPESPSSSGGNSEKA